MNNRSWIVFFFVLLAVGCISSLKAQTKNWRERFLSVGFNVAINPRNPNTIYAEDRTGVLNVSRDKGKSWTPLNPVPGPFRGMRNIFIHPKDTLTIFILRDQGGMWKTVNEGQSWYQVIANYGIDGESIDFDKQHPDTMYAGNFSDGTIYRSTNRGDTWTNQYSSGDWLCGLVVRPDSGNVLLVGSGGGTISKSNDAGVHWMQVFNAHTDEVPKIVFNPAHPLIGYATVFVDAPPETNCGLIKTTDGGNTWFYTAIKKDTALWSLVMDPAHPETLYTGMFSGFGYGINRTTDGGATYQHFQDGINIDLAGGYSGFVAWNLKLNPLAPNDVWLAGSTNSFAISWPGAIYHFVDGSATLVQGTIRDASTSTPISATISVQETFESKSVSGSYSFNYFNDDPTLTPTAHVTSPLYYPKDTSLTFVLNTTQNQDIYLTPLPPSSINGQVFNDLNGNGVKDAGEVGLANWRVRVYGPTNDSVYTDVDGRYSFSSLTAGTYTVSESLEAGWRQSLPASPGTYLVSLGSSVKDKDFGNQVAIYFQDFTSATFPPPTWGILDANATGGSWTRNTTVVHSPPASARDGSALIANGKSDDWLYFSIHLQPGRYRLRWWDRTAVVQDMDSLAVTVGLNAPVSASQTIYNHVFNTFGAFEQISQDFSITVDTTYYISFHDYSAAGNTIRIDDVVLQLVGPIYPVDLSLGSLSVISAPLVINPTTHANLRPTELKSLADDESIPQSEHSALPRWTSDGAVSKTVIHPIPYHQSRTAKSTTVYNDSVNVVVQNNGQNSVSYSINWSVSGVSQTPYLGGPVNSLQSQTAKLNYSTSVLGSHYVSATVSAASDGDGSNDQIVGHSRVYPSGIVSMSYDDGDHNPFKGTVGFGDASTFTAVVRMTAPQTLQLGQVDAYINNMAGSDSMLVRIWNAGANNSTPGNLLYSKKFGGNDYRSVSSQGEYLSLPLDVDAPSFYAGSDFWVSITYTGLTFPQGADYGGDPSRSLYSGDTGNSLNWKPAYSSWILRAVGTPLVATGSISGLKFNDVNANGTNDAEPVLQGWTIQLSGTVNGSMQTNISGQYSFTGLPAGSYSVSEVLQTGWTQTSSPSPISLSSGQNSTGNDFGNFQYVISGTKYRDAENDSSVVGNPALDGWAIKLYDDQSALVQTKYTSGGGHYSFVGIVPGTYTVEESLQVGWVETVPRVADIGISTGPRIGTNAGPRAYVITIGATTPDTGKDFGNFNGGSLTVRKFEDADGDFNTTGDRTLKGWHLEIHQGSLNGPVVAAGDDDSVTANQLVDGTYYAVEADSNGWVHLGYIIYNYPYNNSAYATSDNSISVPISDGENQLIDFVNAPPVYSQMYRTAKAEDWANALDQHSKRSAIKRKADKVKFKFNILSPAAATGFTLKFSMKTDGALTSGKAKLDTLGSWMTKDTVSYVANVSAHDTFQVEGYGAKGMKLRTSVIWLTSPRTTTVRLVDTSYKQNSLRLPMPNLHNVGEELFPKGFGQNNLFAFPNGMVVGVPQGLKGAHSVIHKKYSDVMKTLVKVSMLGVRLHGLEPRCLDVFNGINGNGNVIDRQQVGLAPDKHNNKLLAELTALKLNVAASAFNKFPNGLGVLTFYDGSDPSNLLNGQPIDTIIVKADRVISCLVDTTKLDTLTPGDVYDVIRRIDSVFSSQSIDTNSFATKTSLTGVKRLIDVPFLHPTPGITPENHISPPVAMEEMPVRYALRQNYPNPFNPATTIQFELPGPSVVTMKIYNMLGQEITTLLNKETMDEGVQGVEFNAGNLSSGVYFYRIVAEPLADEDGTITGKAFTSVKKMLLLK